MKYKWQVFDRNALGQDVAVADASLAAHALTSLTEIDLSLKASVFSSGLIGDFFKLSLSATNGDDAEGKMELV